MPTKVKASPSLPKKSRSKSKVTHLDPERIKESEQRKWEEQLAEFFKPLSKSERELILKFANVISGHASKKTEPGEVIQFTKGTPS